ncbi:hypothetical protein TG4357_03135 [Thalassovita gelatinovora]|uniref:Thymidylate synthase n=1 Tax=Thalassovita gelatinovora TaxID=53501 RepID=A0A0P1FIA4_THAGE|nr:hypothetical protein [Thalassovita gelatinovora]QIZ82104.1 hypothetical protein HFZ77_17290 [Thalassovita gelatinovora]CUH67662.1 hypothetical protein TG4357_03135 [Thalassovita gelatinovora]SEP69871.1 hypothetical protein SAMN04488043_101125 [Thalassovita gelatinovora]
MTHFAKLLAAPVLLAACTADPGGVNTDVSMAANPAAEAVAGSLEAVDYDADSGELILRVNAIHGGTRNATYTRVPALDTAGYQGYMMQQTPADRHYTALFQESNGNEVVAGVVADGGNNNRYFGGGFYARQGAGIYSPYDHPVSEGEAQYFGTYAAVTNVDGAGAQLLDDSGIPTNLTPPGQADRITGIILLNADFANGQVDAEISNRVLVDDLPGLGSLPDIMLVATAIDDNGEFAGSAEYQGDVGNTIGDYAGIFGGAGATAVGGVVYLTEFDEDGPLEGEEEYGVFVLTRCGAANDDPVCDNL